MTLAEGVLRRAADRCGGPGTAEVRSPSSRWRLGDGPPEVTVHVHDERAFPALLRHGSVGLAQSYAEGWWDCDDLTLLVRLLMGALSTPRRWLDDMGRALDGPLRTLRRTRAPSPVADRRNARAHYDLPPRLFEAMLDPTLTYSCAFYEHRAQSLLEAQQAKLERVCQKLALGPDDEVVEIGSGWGSFAIHAAQRTGCRVTTTTISAAQLEVVRRRVRDAGLADRVQVLGVDYRELDGHFDKLVSIEMVEAVDWRRHDDFFATCDRLVRPEGAMLLQAIVIADRSYPRARHHRDFIRQMIFPGGCLPSVSVLVEGLSRAGDRRVVDLEDIGAHYALTLADWRRNLEASWPTVEGPGMDRRFRRRWTLYLAYCEAAFAERHLSNVQLLVAGSRYETPWLRRPR